MTYFYTPRSSTSYVINQQSHPFRHYSTKNHNQASTMTSLSTDFFLFIATASLFLLHKKVQATSTCNAASGELVNSAFLFVKPHANTEQARHLVRTKLQESGLKILSEKDIDGKTIDEKKLIDQHYYAIASKATILPAKDIPVPTDQFRDFFGESWEIALKENRAVNAMDACKRFNCDAAELDAAWGKSKKVVKFGGGFYCGLVSMNGKDLYVFNAFFMTMRSKFVGAGTSIHCYEVEWSPATLSWDDFRNKVLGPTDPADGPKGSIRRTILEQWKELGLTTEPNKGDNGVHASASPFEGLAEKINWLSKDLSKDPFGAALIKAGLSIETINAWSVDPRVNMPDGSKASVFDSLEDMDAGNCLAKLVELNGLRDDGDTI